MAFIGADGNGVVVIVGAGEAGVAAVAALREAGHRGRCILIGAESQLPYERPPLSKDLLLDAGHLLPVIRPKDWYDTAGVELWLGTTACHVDPQARKVQVRRHREPEWIEYDELILATGSAARRFSGAPEGVCYLRDQADALHLRHRLETATKVGIVGGGVVGLEVAAAARQLGKAVVILETASRLMKRAFAEPVSDHVRDMHLAAGVDIRLGVPAPHIERDGEGFIIRSGDDTWNVDVCLAAVGAVPATRIAELAGCALCDASGAILVDGVGRTSVPHIRAAGEVAAFFHPLADRVMHLESWQHAQRHGDHVGRAMFDAIGDYVPIPWFWTDQYDCNIQVAGFVGTADRTVRRGEPDRQVLFHLSGRRMIGVTTINSGRDMRPAMAMIAAGWSGDPDMLADLSIKLPALAGL